MISNLETQTALTAAVRKIIAKVELYNGSALVNTFYHNDKLIDFTVERVGESSKFFGFGVGQKVNIKLIDKERELEITTDHFFKVYLSAGYVGFIDPFCDFFVTEVNRDENTNALSITAYCLLEKAKKHTFAELGGFLLAPYDISTVASACASLFNLGLILPESSTNEPFYLEYANGANFDGTETIREVLDDIAEATQTIYFVTSTDLVFRRLDRDGAAALRISKSDYITLDSKTNRRLEKITHATELGDNVTASTNITGTEQVIRDNVFLELREDVAAVLDNALALMAGITINQFELDWRGNFLLQIGDKLELETKDGGSAVSYLLDDSLTYNGGLQQHTRWSYEESESVDSNPTNLGDALKQTFARVDKANKKIDLVASEADANAAALASLQINTESINATVEEIKKTTVDAVDDLSESVATLKQSVEASVTAEGVSIAIKEELSNGVDKVETATGYKLDADGLEISKTGSEMTTKITEDGMEVAKNGETVLTANNQGVNAKNLHATTYLIVGNSSRFEDYEKDGEQRTGCFWIGGAN